jgi:hypothetical protein
MNLSKYSISFVLVLLIFTSPFLLAQEDFIWSQDIGSTGTDYGHCGTTDSAGSILLTGEFQSTITFPSGVTMTSQGNYDYFLVKFDKNGNALWKRTAGSGPGSSPERGYGVRFDLLGNIVTCGSFFSTTTWEGGGKPDTTINSTGNLDGFIAKYDSAGKLLWVNTQKSVAQVVTYKVAIDNSNNIICGGYFGSSTSDSIAHFDTISIKSNKGRNGFVAKYDQFGHALWAKPLGGLLNATYNQTDDAIVDSIGNVYICGMVTGPSNFSGIILNCDTIDSWKNGLTPDAYVAKYSPDGDIIWAKNFGGHNEDNAYELSLDGKGNLYVIGNFDSAAVFGSIGVINANGNRGPDAFLAKLDTSGNVIWVRTGGGAGVVQTTSEYGYSVVIDKTGNIWTAGSFQGTGNFSGTQITSKGAEDIFIAKYNPSGDLLLLKRAGGTGLDRAFSCWLDPAGDLYTTGRFQAIADFGAVNITSKGGDDIFLSKLGNALPVELSSFGSIINGRDIILNWETKTELNSKQFEIGCNLMGSNGMPTNWTNVGTVKAAGNTVSPNKYSFTQKDLQNGRYQYRLKMIDFDGSFAYSKIIEVKIGLPLSFELSQNYPNPFNPSTIINYQLPVDSKVNLEVFSVTGQKMAEIVNQDQSAGYYSVSFGLTAKLSSGVYFYRLNTVDKVTGNNFTSIKKMMLLK